MFYAKVIGKTYSNFKHYSYEGIEIKILQDINPETGDLINKPIFALDAIGVGIGEYVIYEVSVEASNAFDGKKVLTDASIIAIVDSVDLSPKGIS
ncbi:MAG: EutN/CcmL family microcompartment protein [Candidatus Humimicrobiaceae bacterium]